MSSKPPSSHNENENDSETENQPKPVLKKALYASTKDRNHIRESYLLHRKKFVNPWRPNFDLKGAGQMGPYGRLDKYYNDIKIRKESEKNADFQNVPLEKIKAKLLNPPKNKIQVVWIGHATCLVQMHGVTILTDPIFGMRANLFESFGPKRYNPPPFTLKDLQDNDIKIDVAVVSHNHFDHLDKEAVLELKDTVMWFVPVNMKHWFAFQKTTNVVELDWWQGVKFTTDGIDAELSKQKTIPYLVVDCTQGVNDSSNPLSVPLRDDEMIICATPTQHWSKRDLADDFKYFWSSWCFITKEMRAFFGGDSGSNSGLQGHFGTADGSDPPPKFVLQAANALIDKTMALKRRQSGNDNDDTNESGEWTGADLPPPKVREEDSDDIADDNDATQRKTVETKTDADAVEHDSFYENDSHRHHHRHHAYHHKAHANEKHHEQSHGGSHDFIDQTPHHHHHHKHHRRHYHRCERCAEQHDQEEMKRLEARLRVMQAFADATHPNVNVPLADYPKYKRDHPGAHEEDINQRIDNEQHPTQEDWANAIPSHYAEIGDTLGPFDLAMLPIGAYAPRDLMCCQHMCPEEAVAAHIHLRAKQSLGIHWGTFDMYTTEPVYEPPHRVNAEMMRLGLNPEEFFILRHGGVATIDANYQTSSDLSINYAPRKELPPDPSQEHDDNEDNVG